GPSTTSPAGGFVVGGGQVRAAARRFPSLCTRSTERAGPPAAGSTEPRCNRARRTRTLRGGYSMHPPRIGSSPSRRLARTRLAGTRNPISAPFTRLREEGAVVVDEAPQGQHPADAARFAIVPKDVSKFHHDVRTRSTRSCLPGS